MKRTPRFRGSRAVAIAAVTGTTLALAACASASGGDGAGGGGTAGGSSVLHVSFATAPESLDPAISCTNEDRELTDSIYVRLLDYGTEPGPAGTTQINNAKVVPYLARSWTASNGGKTYTFHLNAGWKFPNGDPMNAAAVKYSLDRTIEINNCAATILNDLYSKPNLIKSIEAPNASTVVVNMTKPDPEVLFVLADTSGGIVDPKVVNAHGGVAAGKPNTWMASHSAGGGPFVLTSYVPGTSAVLTANPTYGGHQPASKQINVTWATSAATQLLNVQNGTTDIAYGLSDSAMNSLRSNQNVKVVSYDDVESMQMIMPNNVYPWTNRDVREAVVKAMPIQDIIKNVIYGFGKAYYGPIPPSFPGYSAKYGQPVVQDVAAAKKLIAASGLKTPINVTLDIEAGDQNQKTLSTIIQSSLNPIGVKVSINTLTSSAYADAVYNHKDQAALRFDGPAIANTGYYLQYDEACGIAYNTGNICVPANTHLLAQARATSNAAEQNQLYAQLTKNWVAAYPRVTFYLSLTPFALSKSVKSFYFSLSLNMAAWGKS